MSMPDPPSSFLVTPDMKPKTRLVVAIEGFLYFFIGAATQATTMLGSDAVLDSRGWAVLIISSLAGGAVSLKAFFSQSYGGK